MNIKTFKDFINEGKDADYIAYIDDKRRPGGTDKEIMNDYNLQVLNRTKSGFDIKGTLEDIEAFIEDYGIILDEEPSALNLHESMSFEEIRDEYKDNPYDIGAQSLEYVEGKNGNSSKLIFRHSEKSSRDQIESKLKSLGVPAKKLSKSVKDKTYKYRYELTMYESARNHVNEGKEDSLSARFTEITGISEWDKVKSKGGRGTFVVTDIWEPRTRGGLQDGVMMELMQGKSRTLMMVMDGDGKLSPDFSLVKSQSAPTRNHIDESIDVKYWADYHTNKGNTFIDASIPGRSVTSGFLSKVADAVEDEVRQWNSNNRDGKTNEIGKEDEKRVMNLALDFFKAAGWISTDIIQAMIAQS